MSYAIEFAGQNPWWRDQRRIQNDKHIQALASSRYRWTPRIKYFIDLTHDIVYTLRGPRQVGKTTLLKIIIAEQLKKGVPAQNLFYYACDLVGSPKELASIVERYVTTRRSKEKKARLVVFLDEVTSVKGWQKAIKFVSDSGVLRGVTIIVSGSHSLDVRVSAEQLPGRRGERTRTPDLILSPMKFAEYATMTNSELDSLLKTLDLLRTKRRQDMILSLLKGTIPSEIEKLALELQETNTLLDSYLLTGGIPRCVNEYAQEATISESTYRTYVDVVKGDLMRYNKNENYLRQILRRIFQTSASPVGWSTLKQGTDVASSNTVEDYAMALDSSFVLGIFYRMNALERTPEYSKDKKIIVSDPFFSHALHAWVVGKPPFDFAIENLRQQTIKSVMVEQVVGEHCVRLAYSLTSYKQLFDYKTRVMFWRSREGREVDYVVLGDVPMIPIEVKYQKTIGREDLYGMADFRKTTGTKGGLILSEHVLSERNGCSIVPTSTFLLLI